MALPTPFRFGDDSGWAAGPFILFQREMNRLLDDVTHGAVPATASQGGLVSPRIDVYETDNDIRVSAELPGVTEDDVEVDLEDDLLTIRAEKKEEREVENADQRLTERVYGIFQRSMRLPFPVDPATVEARMENGVLRIAIPKTKSESRQRRIQIGRRDRDAPSTTSPGDGNGAAAQAS